MSWLWWKPDEARGSLLELVLDRGNTFVTQATTEALLRGQDPAGLAVVASALAALGPGQPNHVDWIHAAVLDVFMVSSRDRDAVVRVCEVLARGRDEQVRRGADLLIAALAGISPLLRPEQDG